MRRYGYRRRREMIGGKQTEADLVVCIVRDLNTLIPGCYAWRMETRGLPKRTKTGWKIERNEMELGKPDIAGCVYGKSFVIEVKLPGASVLKPHQFEWLSDFVHRGKGRAAVCRSSQQAMDFVELVESGVPDRMISEIP